MTSTQHNSFILSLFSLLRKSLVRSSGTFSNRLSLTSFCILGTGVLLLTPSDAYAVKAGEMKVSVDYVTALLDNNIVPLVLTAGVVAGTAFAFLKSAFAPLIISLVTAVGYGFAHKWLTTVYALCV